MFGRSISHLASLFLVLLCLTPHVLADPEEQFQDLVRDVPEEILHAALHDYGGPKFQHGVFPGDRPALDVIHRERAADATRLVKLAKRQAGNNTTATNTPTSPATTTPLTTSGQTPTRTPTTTNPPASSGPTSRRATISSTSTSTRTVSGPNGLETFTDIIIVTPTEEPTAAGETTSTSTSSTEPPGLSGGLRVSAANGALVAVVAALGFFML